MASTRFTTEYEPNTGDIDVFINFVKNGDTGRYKCKAENMYGSDETNSTLFIIDVPNIDERPQTQNPDAFKNLDAPMQHIMPDLDENLELQPPLVIIPLNDKLIREELPVELLCKIIGNPKPKVPNTIIVCMLLLKLIGYLLIRNTKIYLKKLNLIFV
jgi:hypothetical protein